MAIELWTPEELFLLRQDERMNPLPSYILDTYFPTMYFSEEGEIRFADLPEADRFMAPFVLPYEQGRPMWNTKAETVKAIRPPYMKPKNAVRPEDAKNIRPSEVYRNRGGRFSLQDRFNARVQELTDLHLRAIRVREIWMACRAFFDGKVQIDYERDQGAANPSVLLDFGRDASHTVVKTADYWSDPATPILDDVEGWMNTMYLANGGGAAGIMLVGAQVAPLFRRNTQIKDMLDTRYRGNEDVVINTGMMRTERPLNYVGKLDTNLEVWSYKDTIDIPSGTGMGKTKVDLFNEKDICLIAPGATGVRAHGPIYDTEAIDAGLQNSEIFGKMWESKDPGEKFVMHQSSKLPIPTNPNKTFRARVLA